jgi:hypothetical protein
MAINPRLIAVEGVTGGPIEIATAGLIVVDDVAPVVPDDVPSIGIVRWALEATAQVTESVRALLYVGDSTDIRMSVYDAHTRTLADPSTLKVIVSDPSEVESTYTYGDDANVTRTSVGKYTCAVDCDAAGVWSFTVISPGPTAQGFAVGSFSVFRPV